MSDELRQSERKEDEKKPDGQSKWKKNSQQVIIMIIINGKRWKELTIVRLQCNYDQQNDDDNHQSLIKTSPSMFQFSDTMNNGGNGERYIHEQEEEEENQHA